jgi:hypothetical protein
MSIYELLYEKSMVAIPEDMQKTLRSQQARKNMSDDSFLIPSERKFPIKDPKSGKIDCRLIYAAYIRAKQWEKKKPQYSKIASNAKDLFKEHGCSKLLNLNLESKFASLSPDDRKTIELIREDLLHDDIKELNESGTLQKCICGKCGYVDVIGLDETLETKTCPMCDDSILMNSLSEIKNDESTPRGKLSSLLQESTFLGSENFKRCCPECGLYYNAESIKHDQYRCCNCGNATNEILESQYNAEVFSKYNYSCPNCSTIAISENKIHKNISCPLCNKYMVETTLKTSK